MSASIPNPLKTPRQCRHIKPGGEQCRNRARMGHHFCHHHKDHRSPALTGLPGRDRVLFLEDSTSIQLVLSQLMQGLLDGLVEPRVANSMFYGASIATTLVRHEFERERWYHASKKSMPETVLETETVDATELAPDKAWVGPTGEFDPNWSISKYMYEQACEEAGKPKPTCAADFPPEGWLTEEEIREQQNEDGARAMIQRYEQRLAAIRQHRAAIEAEETRAALAAGLPDPHAQPKSQNPNCPFGVEWCQGVRDRHRCGFCAGDVPMKTTDPRYPGDEAVARVATLREYLEEKQQQQQATPPTVLDQDTTSAHGTPQPAQPTVVVSGHDFQSCRTSPHNNRALAPAASNPEMQNPEATSPSNRTTPPTVLDQGTTSADGTPQPAQPTVVVSGHDFQSCRTHQQDGWALAPAASSPATQSPEATNSSSGTTPPAPPTVFVSGHDFQSCRTHQQNGRALAPAAPPTTPDEAQPTALQSSTPEKERAFRPASQPNEEGTQPATRNPKPDTRIPQPETRNPEDDLPDPCFESEPDTDENGECWCGGPHQMFPCHECRAKKENPGLDLKAVAQRRPRSPRRSARCFADCSQPCTASLFAQCFARRCSTHPNPVAETRQTPHEGNASPTVPTNSFPISNLQNQPPWGTPCISTTRNPKTRNPNPATRNPNPATRNP